jgi:hypothetical protein
MALTTISPEAQQKLAVFVPLIALGVSLFVVYPAYGRYSNLNQQIEKNRKELETLKNTPPPPAMVGGTPTADDVVSEPAQFLGLLKRLAATSGCALTSVDLSPSAAPKTDQGPVRPVQARIEVVGQYRQIRSFLWQVAHAGRLLSVAELSMVPAVAAGNSTATAAANFGASGVRASVTLERYIATTKT